MYLPKKGMTVFDSKGNPGYVTDVWQSSKTHEAGFRVKWIHNYGDTESYEYKMHHMNHLVFVTNPTKGGKKK